MQKVKHGRFVTVHYKGTLKNGDIFDTTEDCGPMEIRVGAGEMVKGFEDAIIGMGANEKKIFTIEPQDAYGFRDENNIRTFPRKDVPPDLAIIKGDIVGIRSPDGDQIPARITQFDDIKVVLDLNHPLADMPLTYEVEVVGISEVPTQMPDDCSTGCECYSKC